MSHVNNTLPVAHHGPGNDHPALTVTEGQLKWAQFHAKRRAQQIKEKVDELWQTPASVSDVEGAVSDDGNTTEESMSLVDGGEAKDEIESSQQEQEEEEHQQSPPSPLQIKTATNKQSSKKSKSSIKISRGRRAMLRVSKRAFRQRQEEIRKHGFKYSCEMDENWSSDDDDLAAKYADETAWRKARRKRRQSRRKKKSDQDRLKRFENAFRAMMMSLAASQPQHPELEIETPTRVWQRPENAPAFVSIDGRQYLDLKWGVSTASSSNQKAGMLTTTDFSSIPVDPQASWLVHIPSKQGAGNHNTIGPFLPTNANGEILVPENVHGTSHKLIPVSLGSEKFNEIVGALQKRAEQSQQESMNQMETIQNRSHTYKWQIPSANTKPENDNEDDRNQKDDEEDDDEFADLNQEDLKEIAAQYLSEFVANSDEEHLIAALGEKYRDDVESLVEATSEIGVLDATLSDSKDIVRQYLQGKQDPNSAAETKNDNHDDEDRKSAHRDQMASFAGIAARYLAEVSRPRSIERTVKDAASVYRQEQAAVVSTMKAFLENWSISEPETFEAQCNPKLASDMTTERRFESLMAKYINKVGQHRQQDIITELQRREGKDFTKLMTQYLAGVQKASLQRQEKREKSIAKKRRSSIASRYIENLGAKENNRNEEEEEISPSRLAETINEEQRTLESLAMDYFAEVDQDLDRNDVYEELRQEKRRLMCNLLSKYVECVNKSIESVDTEASKMTVEQNEYKDFSDEMQDSTPKDYEAFNCNSSFFRQLGESDDTETAHQKTFEAIASRYLGEQQWEEDALFSELGKDERQGFSRLVTRYLDEMMETKSTWNVAKLGIKAKEGVVTQYLNSIQLDQEAREAARSMDRKANQKSIEAIVCRYISHVYEDLREEEIAKELLKHQKQKFCSLLSVYLSTVVDCVSAETENLSGPASAANGHHVGKVQEYFTSLQADSSTKGRNESRQVELSKLRVGISPSKTSPFEPKDQHAPSAPSSREHSSATRNSEGVAARYLSNVIDDYDEDDIFAELRKQESPRFVENGGSSPRKLVIETARQTPQSVGDRQFTPFDSAELKRSLVSCLSELRTDCLAEKLRADLGEFGDNDQDRAFFATAVCHLLQGVETCTLKPGMSLNQGRRANRRSRASASRYLAAMRGIADEPEGKEDIEFEIPYESAVIDDAVSTLDNFSSCNVDKKKLSWALRRFDKTKGEQFANSIRGYLKSDMSIGKLVPTNEEKAEIDANKLLMVGGNVHQNSTPDKLNSADTSSQTGSDVFSVIRQGDFESQYRLSPAESFASGKGTGSKSRLSRGRDSFQPESIEEKKTAEPSFPSPTFSSPTFEVEREDDPSFHDETTHDLQQQNQEYESPSRSFVANSEFSPEHLREFHNSVMEKSALIGECNAEQTIIDTDGTTSEASDSALSPRRVAGLMLSPTILTKRHKQAIHAIENRKWDQATYLLSANPWLAEMPEIRTNQYLLHKLALYGEGNSENPAAPEQLCLDLVKMYPAAQKFDNEGNLPLHMASIATNLRMISILGDRFVSGASVRNEDGMLPLHLALSSKGKHLHSHTRLIDVVKALIAFFPGALAVPDNAGNLPLHLAAQFLDGDQGVDVINFLLDESERQLNIPTGIRFRNKKRVNGADNASLAGESETTTDVTDYSNEQDEELPPTMIVNEASDTPLWVAIRRLAGSEIIESLTIGPGGKLSALKTDGNQENALHKVLNDRNAPLAAVRSILKVASEAALEHNREGRLPIQVASIWEASSDVIFELLLADLPINLADPSCITETHGGESWWHLTCDCNDQYLDVVERLISQCSYEQVHELCFVTHDQSGVTLISSASPGCREFLTVSLLFVGRFEFLASAYESRDVTKDVKKFAALDYGTDDCPYENGRPVQAATFFSPQISGMQSMDLDFNYVEQVSCFVVGERDSFGSGGRKQFCVAIEQPNLTLDRVVAGMLKNDACRQNSELRQKYILKMFAVLRVIAKALHTLHSFGIVHGNVAPHTCAKFGNTWKLANTLAFQRIGFKFDPSKFGTSVPPEALEPTTSTVALERRAIFRTNVDVDPSIDVWGFGKLAYDVLVGDPLVDFDSRKEAHEDHKALLKVLQWSTLDLVEARRCLRRVGVPDAGVELITRCLSQDPSSRPSNMKEVLRSGMWDEPHQTPRAKPGEPTLHEC